VFQCLNVINKGRKLYERVWRATSITTCQLWHATKVQTGQKHWQGAQFGLMNPQLALALLQLY